MKTHYLLSSNLLAYFIENASPLMLFKINKHNELKKTTAGQQQQKHLKWTITKMHQNALLKCSLTVWQYFLTVPVLGIAFLNEK